MPNADAPGNDFAHIGNGDIASMASTCTASAQCKAFNQGGWLKTTVQGLRAQDGTTLYLKQPCRPEDQGYVANANVDAPGNDMRNVGTDSCAQVAACTLDAACQGFNEAGWLKNNVQG